MTCASEGAIDVFIEPFMQARRLVVVGATPVAEALTRVARSMDYDVVRVVDEREARDTAATSAALGASVVTLDALAETLRQGSRDQAVVVASQGHYDEEALESVLKCDVGYVGLVASGKRGSAVRPCSNKAERGELDRFGILPDSISAPVRRRRLRSRSLPRL
jgi:xanthine dehydrogenase accessory factor